MSDRSEGVLGALERDKPIARVRPALDEEIAEHMEVLRHKDGSRRRRARQALVEIGRPSVPALIEYLRVPDVQMRWEAAKALSDIADPGSAPALVQALDDDAFEIRWLASEGLVAIGKPGLRPLLHALALHVDSPWLREGAHHVLYELERRQPTAAKARLLRAFGNPAGDTEITAAARALLREMREPWEARRGA